MAWLAGPPPAVGLWLTRERYNGLEFYGSLDVLNENDLQTVRTMHERGRVVVASFGPVPQWKEKS